MKILDIFFFWRFGIFILTYLGSQVFPLIENNAIGAIGPGKQFSYWASWAQWDGGHYLDIAKSGYTTFSDYAFFPLYPMVVKLLASLTGLNLIASGLLISNVAFILFLLLFFNLISQKFKERIAYTTVVTFLFFPTTFFATAFYTESLFLLFAALVFFFLQKKNFLAAAIFASLASLTRLVGAVLAISIFYSYVSSIKFNLTKLNFKLLHVAVATFGITIYSFYLFTYLNDPLGFLTSQSFWQRTITDPISTIMPYVFSIITGENRPFNDWIDLSLTLLFLTILALGVKKIPSSMWIFSVLAILIPASTGTLTSMPRYLLASLGPFIIIGQYLDKRPNLKYIVWTISLLVQIFFAVRFINGYWVA